jgi:hypothetical protein
MAGTTTETIEIEAETSSDYRRIVIGDVIVSIDSGGLKMLVYSQRGVYDQVIASDPLALVKKRVKRIAECELIMNPSQLKSLYISLGDKLKEYEDYFGNIPSPEELKSKSNARKSKDAGDLEKESF